MGPITTVLTLLAGAGGPPSGREAPRRTGHEARRPGADADVVAAWDEIVVPLDPRDPADRALAVALALVGRTGARLRLLAVAGPGRAGDAAAARLADVAARLEASSGSRTGRIEVEIDRYGSIANAVARAGEATTLVCMASHGGTLGGHHLLGTIGERVAAVATQPVLLVGPRVTGLRTAGRRVVACLDADDDSWRAVPVAGAWSRLLGLPLWLARVAPAAGARARHAGSAVPPAGAGDDVAGTTVLHDDRPAHALALLAEAAPAAVLVVAGHGRTGWSRLIDGSTTAALVREAPVPVLLVPHGPDRVARGAGRARRRGRPRVGGLAYAARRRRAAAYAVERTDEPPPDAPP